MYTPEAFRTEDRAALLGLIRRHGFGILFSAGRSDLLATHLPFLIDPARGARGTLVTHMARANPHWRSLDSAREVLVVFTGPNAYVSPSWYTRRKDVPTWNYAAVHARGRPITIDEPGQLRRIVEAMTRHHEAGRDPSWTLEGAGRLVESGLKGIVGIEIPIESLDGKFKLSQNLSLEDRAGVVRALERSTECRDREVAEEMRAGLRSAGKPDIHVNNGHARGTPCEEGGWASDWIGRWSRGW